MTVDPLQGWQRTAAGLPAGQGHAILAALTHREGRTSWRTALPGEPELGNVESLHCVANRAVKGDGYLLQHR